MQWTRALGLLVALAALARAGDAAALSTPALVVDADSGRVLYQERATDPWFPASITKLMTVYVALDQVRRGRASMDQLLTVTPAAAAEPPSKMGFKPGTQITLDNALKIIMVKSANDVSWTIAEGIGGSTEGFAALMNEASARLGMTDSRWFNPNGLPDERQWTTARDMAILGRALLREFPDNRELFSISAIQFGRSVMANHNGLLGRYAGVDGMKTGFICSGGFNVVASATRNGRRIITVVMGSPSAKERTLKAADLFDYGFAQGGFSFGGTKLEELPRSALAAPPDMRPVICGGKTPQEDDAQPAVVASGGNSDNASTQLMAAAAPASTALAFAAMNSAAWKARPLPPRAPLQPVLVWLGRDPAEGALLAEAAQAPKARAKVAARPAVKARSLAARRGAPPASATAFAAPDVTPVIEGGAKIGGKGKRPDEKKADTKKPDAKQAAVAKPEARKAEAKKPGAKVEAKQAAAKPTAKKASRKTDE
jgi:D-alanyl-D-alanine carboxypeptidase